MTPLRWTTLVLCAVALFVLWPLWPPLVLAAWTAALTRPLLARFEKGLKGRRRAAATLSLLLFVVLAFPLALMTIGVISGAQELVATVEGSPSTVSALQTLTSSPDAPLPSSFADVVALLQRSGTQGLGLLTNVAGAAAKGLVGLFIYFAGAYVLLLDSAALWEWLKQHSPLDPKHLQRLGNAFHETGRGLLVGVGLTSATQGLIATIIYVSLGVPRAWVLGPITGIASVVPLVGTSLVWGPIALGLFLTERPIKALVLVALGIGVISLVDNLLRPIYARLGALQLPLFVLFVSVFGGLVAFGTWGALMGPLIVRLALEALEVSREERTSA
ncbi:MAG: AI-2E family transporter [Archangium sp.]|nr:AI-2E family transporter [Archangium sp.]